MASSKLTEDGRYVEITTPAAGYPTGYRFHAIGSGATYGIRPSDWVLRLVGGYYASRGKAWGEGVDVRPAEEALCEALANGSVHESLIEEPREAA